MNIITGQIAHPDVNADDAVSLGQRAMSIFKAGWPGSFYGPLGKLVVTMDVTKKHVLVSKESVYDQELIDVRVIGLLVSSREINFDDVLAYELAAYPPSMFNPCGEMKITKSKSTLKLKHQVGISEGNCPIPATLIYDVSALLWVLTWPPDKLHVYVDAFLMFVHQALQKSNVTLVFDRYFPTAPRTSRRCKDGSHRVHKLTPEMPAPAKPVILTNTKNKIQLNAMLIEGLLNSDYYMNATQKHTFTTAGVSDVPVEIVSGVRIDQHDLCSIHEETDIVITQHAISCSLSGNCVRVVCDETDVGVTATAHSDIAGGLLAIHGISGADIVASLHGVGKATVIKIAKKGTLSLSKVGDVNADMKSVQAQATKFMCATYGKVAEPCTYMTKCRVNMWRSKTGKSGTSSVKLCLLLPTNDAFVKNIN